MKGNPKPTSTRTEMRHLPHNPHNQKIGRREFILRLGSVSFLAVLSACRRFLGNSDPIDWRNPSPPHTATKSYLPSTPRPASAHRATLSATLQRDTYLPLVLSGSEAATAMNASPSAMRTAKPTRTSTPRPTSTPSPTATPFPPGPPTKLGLFVTHHHRQILELVRTGNVAVIKTISHDADFLSEVKAISPKTLIVGRLSIEHQIDYGKVIPKDSARWLVDQLLPIATDPRLRVAVDAWEGYNEPVVVNVEQMKRLAELETERVRLLAREGIRSVVGNFGTGNPALELWPYFFPALH